MAEKITRTILVTGATGHQGSALSRTLSFRGHKVRAFTRHPRSDEAERVSEVGADIVTGDFEDKSSLVKAMDGCDAVFAMGTPYEKGVEAEIREAENVLDAAEEAGIDHIVYSSVASSSRDTGIAHFESKRKIEERLFAGNLPFTIVAPVFFMENLWSEAKLGQGIFSWGIPRARRLQQIALEDLAEVCAEILELRDPYLGERFELASDELSGDEAARILSEVTGRDFSYQLLSPEEKGSAFGDEYVTMLRWLSDVGFDVDVTAVHQRFSGVDFHTFERWAKEQDWSFVEKSPGVPLSALPSQTHR